MSRQRAPYAKRSVWYAVLILAVVVVVGFAGAAYELNHLRTEINSQGVRINDLESTVAVLRALLRHLGTLIH
jgi:hypothetical protein